MMPDFIETIKDFLPISPNWYWYFRRSESYAAIELVGIYKGNDQYIIKTMLSYSAFAAPSNPTLYINATVQKAEN